MGMFLSLTSVVGKSQNEVVNCLTKYAKSVGGGLKKEGVSIDDYNCCVIEEANGNTSIYYPNDYLEWDNTAIFISKDLNAPVFSFHIHDGDFWMYLLFVNGELIDRFNPMPDYWQEEMSEEDAAPWKGNATTITRYVSQVKVADIDKYLVRWDMEEEEQDKAYPEDDFTKEDWQLLDFMRKLKLPYPLDDEGNPKGQVYKLWTEQLKLNTEFPGMESANTSNKIVHTKKPWWKFW